MSVNLVKRGKCQGCKALRLTDNGFVCNLGFSIDFKTREGHKTHYFSPVPSEECYKPKTMKELKAAKLKMNEKSERTPEAVGPDKGS